ncbi:MAG: transporter substrate-binding domain-containing protein [Sulfuricellaceae bacterium]
MTTEIIQSPITGVFAKRIRNSLSCLLLIATAMHSVAGLAVEGADRKIWAAAVPSAEPTKWFKECPNDVDKPSAEALKKRDEALKSYPPGLRGILEKKVLTVGLKEGDSVPFFYAKNPFDPKAAPNADPNELAGIDIDLALQIGRELEVCVEFQRDAKNFDNVVGNVINGKVDVAISKISVTSSRTLKVLYSKPYAVFRHGLLVNRKSIKGMGDGQLTEIISYLRGKKPSGEAGDYSKKLTLGVIENSSYHQFAKDLLQLPPESIRTYADWPALVKAVRKGDVAAAYRDEFEIKKVLSDDYSQIVDMAAVAIKGQEDQIAMVVSVENPHLKYWLDNFLDRYLAKNLIIQRASSQKLKKCGAALKKFVNSKYLATATDALCQEDKVHVFDTDAVLAYEKKYLPPPKSSKNSEDAKKTECLDTLRKFVDAEKLERAAQEICVTARE